MADGISRQKLSVIQHTFLFRDVDEIVVRRIVSDPQCSRIKYAKGSVVFDETHFQNSLGIILSGSVRVDKMTPEGKYMKMSVLRVGECFGAAAMFTRRDHYATVITAESPVEVLFIPEETIRWAIRRDFAIGENYIQYLSDRIWFLNEKISSLSAGSAERRLAMFLMEHCDESGSFSSTMTDLSRRLNIGRASLYRAVDKLEKAGLIQQNGKQIQILNQDKLKRYINEE